MIRISETINSVNDDQTVEKRKVPRGACLENGVFVNKLTSAAAPSTVASQRQTTHSTQLFLCRDLPNLSLFFFRPFCNQSVFYKIIQNYYQLTL